MSLNPQRTISELKELRELTSDANGAQRVAWTPMWLRARFWFEDKLRDLPVEHHFDAAGNRWVTLEGASRKTLLIGGHLDSVPNGGWLDGCLGGPRRSRNSAPLRGSIQRPTAGHRPPDRLGRRRRRAFRPQSAGLLRVRRHAYHRSRPRPHRSERRPPRRRGEKLRPSIWSGSRKRRWSGKMPPLTSSFISNRGRCSNRSIWRWAPCWARKAVERWAITFFGQEAHSGSTPMNARRDALAGAAKLALEIRRIAKKHPDAVCTMGSVKTFSRHCDCGSGTLRDHTGSARSG